MIIRRGYFKILYLQIILESSRRLANVGESALLLRFCVFLRRGPARRWFCRRRYCAVKGRGAARVWSDVRLRGKMRANLRCERVFRVLSVSGMNGG